VATLAAALGACVALGHADSPLPGDEATARQARYRWLARVATNVPEGTDVPEVSATAVATGHTRDDQAETVLLNLARGGGLRGAAGMEAVAAWPVPAPASAGLRLIRPLLEVSRAEISGYLEALGVEARLDPTNELSGYARNRVRREVLPALETVNSEVRAHLAEFAGRAREADEALDAWAAREFAELAAAELAAGEARCVRIDRRRLLALPAEVARRVIVIAGRSIGLELNARQRAALLEITSKAGARVDLSGGAGATAGQWLTLAVAEERRLDG
jgi:tRNA(Ile)-lysidine synthase